MPYPGTDTWVDKVRQAVDIVDVVSRTVPLKKKGRHLWGLCPFHSEKTPSFSVDPDQQLFYCFGCHAGGTVFTFLMRLGGKEFRDVVEELAEEAGIERPRDGREDPDQGRRLRILSVLEWTQGFFRQQARDSADVVEAVLEERKIPRTLAERFDLGYAPNSWDALVTHLRRRGVEAEEMESAGVVMRRQDGRGVYDRWRHRLMFPIRDRKGRVVGFGGRALGEGQEPKYLNSPETPVFQKGRLLYGLDLALATLRAGQAPLLVEGYFDVIACHAAGATEAVASLGTALTSDQARLLSRFGDRATLFYDADAPGREATKKAFVTLSRTGVRVDAVWVEGGKDPDEYRRLAGDEMLLRAVRHPKPYLEGVISQLKTGVSPREKADAFQLVRPLLAAVGDPVEREGYLELLARTLHMDQSILTHSLDGSQGEKHTIGKNRHNMEGPSKPQLPSVQVRLVASLLRHPEALPEAQSEIEKWETDPQLLEVLAAIAKREHHPDEGWAGWSGWIEGLDGTARQLVLEALAWEGPDGGKRVINEYVEALRRQADEGRWRILQERIRRGEQAADVLTEVREMARRLERYKIRREG